jgi:hypothetical protein
LLISKKSNFIQGHHADFDKYITYKNKKNKKCKFKYFVFLDQNVPHHSDLKRISMADIDEKKYYVTLLFLFKKLEKKFRCKYIISPHPRADVQMLKKYFGSRVSNKSSINLIKNCEFVICHDSTATNFAFLFYKPIITIIDNELINSRYNHSRAINLFCKRAKLKKYNVSNNNMNKIKITLNKKNYKIFIRNYISNNSLNDTRANIILNNIEFKS